MYPTVGMLTMGVNTPTKSTMAPVNPTIWRGSILPSTSTAALRMIVGLTELLLSRGVKHGSQTAQCELWAETVSDNVPLCQLALEFEQNWTNRGVSAKSFVVHLF